jgi:hypothetical protein
METVATRSPAGLVSKERARFWDRPARNMALAAGSLVVIALAAMFVVGGSTGSAVVSFKLTSYAIPSHNIVVYGKVTNASHTAVGGAEVKVYRLVRGGTDVLQSTFSSRQGLYRMTLPLNGSTLLNGSILHVRVSERLRGTEYLGALEFHARSGRAYDVSGQLRRRGSVFFLPVFSY